MHSIRWGLALGEDGNGFSQEHFPLGKIRHESPEMVVHNIICSDQLQLNKKQNSGAIVVVSHGTTVKFGSNVNSMVIGQ